MKTIIYGLKEIEEEASKCRKCGKCQPACPLFRETGMENLTSRSKFAIINSMSKNLGLSPSKVNDFLSFCLLCGRCKSVCSQGLDTQSLFLKARIIIDAFNKKSFLKRLLILIFINLPVNLKGRFKSSEFHDLPKAENSTEKKGKVVFFSGCLFDKFFSDKTEKAEYILKYAGYDVQVVKNQCCGIPHLTSGNRKAFLKSASKLTKKINDCNPDFIVSGCPTCSMTIKELWPEFIENSNLSENIAILDFHQILSRSEIKLGKVNKNKEIKWHNPCHFKSLGIKNEPEILLHDSLGYDFVRSPDTCCGFGGSFSFDHPKISHSLGEKKLRDLKSDEKSILTTGCPACILQLKKAAFFKVEVIHTIDIIYESILKMPNEK